MIETQNLTKYFGKLCAVDSLRLQVESGEIFGFLGPNGAGKTTTINMLTGLLRPTSGTATLGGFDIQEQSLQAKAILGLMPDTPQLYEALNGRQFVRMIADLYEVPPQQAENEMNMLLEQLELTDAADDQIKGYSYGMQKKILLISVLIHHPQILFLDEPTSGLDPKSARTVREILRERCENGCAVFMTTHILEIAERICDRVGIISKGKLIAVGTIAELLQKKRELHTQPTEINPNQTETLEDIFLDLTADG
ncbi:ABC transporter ATP-binding protein [Candidatus Poribacteria bacterium]|nr:ABC transporter ATP-binding protein [Candidatus Poribacteria bacterium]